MKISSYIANSVLSASVMSALLYAAGSHAAALDVSQSPLMLIDSVAPNIIFTLDDSGSMKRSHVPDSISGDTTMRTKRAKSAHFNPIYYNPNDTYIVPTGVNSDGSNKNYSTSFTAAYHMGFDPSAGSVNLSSSYRVTWYCTKDNAGNCNYDVNGFSTVKELAENPREDFYVQETVTSNSSPKTVTTPGGVSYTLTRTNNGCTATASWNGISFNNVPCSRNSNSNTLTVDMRKLAVPAYYYVFDETLNNCDGSATDEDCYTLKLAGDSEKENFATWYSFYRNRALATQSAAMLAFYELPSSMRFTWQSLNNCTALNGGSGCGGNHFRTFTNQHKSNFLTWLTDATFSGGTPLREALDKAGKFLATSTPWAYNPNPIGGSTVSEPRYACRPSYHIMMTDGMWSNDNPKPSGTFRHDTRSFNLPDGTEYNGKRLPFADSTSTTLADLAMHYWATDLSDLDDDLKPYIPVPSQNATEQYWNPRNNPATWQHMVNFTVGLGLSSALTLEGREWDGSTFSGSGYNNLVSGNKSWPATSAGSDNNVYDLWHAAINSRGEFFSADSPDSLVSSFREILNRIAERTSTAAAAGSTTSVSSDDPDDPYNLTILNRAFFPEYNSEDWSGDLKRFDIQRMPDGSIQRIPQWSARTLLTSAAGRNVKMAGGALENGGLRDFTYDNLPADMQALFNLNPDAAGSVTDNKGSQRVSYLLGARGQEGGGDGDFRIRSSVLGDIVNSTPVVVGAPSYVPYLADKIDGTPGTYRAFQQTYKDRPELIYVGANDGMLHAFSAATGQEVFAFVPTAALPQMPKLTGQSYKGGAHRFFVDGSPVVRDVYFNDAWHTVLIGTLGAGGKSLFALDITNPGDNGSGIKLLWEISSATNGFENLGYTFPEPEVVRLHSGEWALLQGNGYDSENDVASLFIINVANGSLIAEIEVDNDENSVNGLSSVRGADNNGDGIVDYAYAGDLKGNLWRFDLSKSVAGNHGDPFSKTVQTNVTAADFRVSYGGTPLFKARYPGANNATHAQAITAPPSLIRHPTMRGYIVVFGSGKYFENADAAPDTTKANTIYGIWDRYTKAQDTQNVSTNNLNRSKLQAQTIEQQTLTTFNRADGGSSSHTVRYVSNTPIIWYVNGTTAGQEADDSKVNKWGWYLDLTVNNVKKGEMMVERMITRGDTLLFGTLTPNADPCADGNEYWAYALNAHRGSRTTHPTFDLNRDGRFDRGDTNNGTAPSGYGSSSPIALTRDGTVIDVGGSMGFATSPDLHGRQSWQTMPLEIDE